MFPSISRLFLRRMEQKSIAKLDGGMAGFAPLLDPPLPAPVDIHPYISIILSAI